MLNAKNEHMNFHEKLRAIEHPQQEKKPQSSSQKAFISPKSKKKAARNEGRKLPPDTQSKPFANRARLRESLKDFYDKLLYDLGLLWPTVRQLPPTAQPPTIPPTHFALC